MQQGCSQRDGIPGIEHRREFVIRDLYQTQRILTEGQGLRHYGSHGITIVAHLVDSNNRLRSGDALPRPLAPEVSIGQVFPGQDGQNPWEPLGLLSVDGADAGMGVGAAQNSAIGGPRKAKGDPRCKRPSRSPCRERLHEAGRHPYYRPRSLGSRASLSASPNRLNPNTATVKAKPGKMVSQGANSWNP